MGHITCQAERDENAKVFACQYRAVKVWRDVEDIWTGETHSECVEENQCGEEIWLSPAKGKCARCGLVFTY